MDIKDAIAKLDPADNDMWTEDGLPRLAVLSRMMGREVTRDELHNTRPGLTRKSLEAPDKEDIVEEKGDLELLKERLATLDGIYEKTTAALNEAKLAQSEVEKMRDDVLGKIEAESPRIKNDFEPFAAFIKRAKEDRLKRAGRFEEVKKALAGIDTQTRRHVSKVVNKGRR